MCVLSLGMHIIVCSRRIDWVYSTKLGQPQISPNSEWCKHFDICEVVNSDLS